MSQGQKRRPPLATGVEECFHGGLQGDYSELVAKMAEAGIVPATTKIDRPGLHRFRAEGDKPGHKNGWCRVFDDGDGAIFGHWPRAIRLVWQRRRDRHLDDADRQRLRRQIEAERRRRHVEDAHRHADAADRARRLWAQAGGVDPDHPYIVAKRISPTGIRQHGNELIVPMRDTDARLCNAQRIRPDGSKRFLPGGRKTGTYTAIGSAVTTIVRIVEGYATGVSVHALTGDPVAVAFDAGNLASVAIALRGKYPHTEIVINGDDDRETEQRIGRNPGREAADRAARAVGGRAELPPAPFNDWNDYDVARRSA